LRRDDLLDGKRMHAEFRTDESIIMQADSADKYPPNNTFLNIYVTEVHSTYNKAVEEAGLKLLKNRVTKKLTRVQL
jgi:uncharacterized glyoxalase superfamily protein PhnB